MIHFIHIFSIYTTISSYFNLWDYLYPFSHLQGKPIRMMGVFDDEIRDMSENSTKNLRIAGFDEAEKRLKQRLLNKPQASLKLPHGTYIFCDFRTLHIPGIQVWQVLSHVLMLCSAIMRVYGTVGWCSLLQSWGCEFESYYHSNKRGRFVEDHVIWTQWWPTCYGWSWLTSYNTIRFVKVKGKDWFVVYRID